jgi:acetyl esterase/lipase
LIVFVHGGGFGGCNSNQKFVIFTAEGHLKALSKGYAVALVDYRTSPEANFPSPIYDVKAAIRYLRANATEYHLDPYNFAI